MLHDAASMKKSRGLRVLGGVWSSSSLMGIFDQLNIDERMSMSL